MADAHKVFYRVRFFIAMCVCACVCVVRTVTYRPVATAASIIIPIGTSLVTFASSLWW